MTKNCQLCGRFSNRNDVTFTDTEVEQLHALILRGDERRLFDLVQRRLAPHRPVRGSIRYRRNVRGADGRPVIA